MWHVLLNIFYQLSKLFAIGTTIGVQVDKRIQQLLDILSTYGMPLEQVNIQRTNRASGP
jgi:hypothetical protein